MIPMQGVAPGQHEIRLVVSVEGGTGFASFEFNRTNDPLELVDPLPELLVPQRGSFVLNASDIATDPDGQPIRILNATLLENESHFIAVISPDQSSMTIYHSVDEEWEGTTRVEVDLEAEGDILDQANVTLEGRILPVNDQLIQLSTIDQQTLTEDGASLFINYGDYFVDPEGQPLTVLINGASQGSGDVVSWSVSNDLPLIEFTPLPDENGAEVLQLSISDGFNPPLLTDVPLRIEAVDDDFVVDETAWSIGLEEEETVLLDLATFASDIDGDALAWSVESKEESKVILALSGQELLVSALVDEWGNDSAWWLNVTDGETVFSKRLDVAISPLPDRPTLANASLTQTNGSSLIVAWDWFDADGDLMDVQLRLNGEDTTGQRTCDVSGSCSEVLEFTFQPGALLSIDILARDPSFSDVVVRLQTLVDDDGSSTNVDEADDPEANSGGTFIAGLIIVPLLAIIGWLLFQFRKPPQEPVEDVASGGLLARAEAKIGQS
jgi:hypothetical protein